MNNSSCEFFFSTLDFILFDLKLGCLIILIHICYYILAHRIQVLTSLIANDKDIQLEAYDCGNVVSLVPVTRLFIAKRYRFRNIHQLHSTPVNLDDVSCRLLLNVTNERFVLFYE